MQFKNLPQMEDNPGIPGSGGDQSAGTNAAALFMGYLYRLDPITLSVGIVPPAGTWLPITSTYFSPKILGAEFIGTEAVYRHIGLTVDFVLGKVAEAYHAVAIAADAAADKINALKASKVAAA